VTDATLQSDESTLQPAPPPPREPAIPAPAILPLSFTGTAGEYFRIWIVNLFLSLVTLGIYSAWAKVRKKRYFYGNTWLDGSNFEYHGDPRAILRGRLMALLFFLTYTLVGEFSHRAAAALALVGLPALPWLLLRSFRFNAVNSSYRHVRFGYHGSYREALVSVLPVFLFPLVTVLLGAFEPRAGQQPTAMELAQVTVPLIVFSLFYPWMAGRLHLIRIRGSRFGTAPFTCSARVGEFYGIYVLGGIISVVVALAVFVPLGALAAFSGSRAGWALIPLGYFAVVAITLGYTQSRVANLLFNAAHLGGTVRLHSTLKARKLAWVYGTNLVAILCTVGLAIPWAAVRTARIRASALEVEAEAGLDAFVATTTAAGTALGDEVGEMFDFDVAL
jgi:uncharacterized membrane protein YjgN (DUF898 family)